MTSSSTQHPLQSPQLSDSESSSSLHLPKIRGGDRRSPLSSLTSLPYRRPNASLSNLFSSTSTLPSSPPSASAATSPPAGLVDGSIFSPSLPKGGDGRPPSITAPDQTDEVTSLILRALVPHVAVLPSTDCDELLRHKGINGGLLELLRPFGEKIAGRVVIRDSTGASRPWDDFGVRFTGVKDGIEAPRLDAEQITQAAAITNSAAALPEYKPARLRTGGDIPQIDEVVERHLAYAEDQPDQGSTEYFNHKDQQKAAPDSSSPFYALYLRRLLSGVPLSPHETFSHPVALVIAISSRNPAPIEELRTLYTSSNTGEHRLPQWVNNEFLRYYVLIHDEDYDDIKKSLALYDQMKRHFGLHCHLLRLRSTQCVPSDDDSIRLPTCEWMSAGEELAEILAREASDDDEDPTSCIFESDAAALRTFVREMVTQSIIPGMERMSATWNDQVASRRRGISGRFMSLSKRFTPFGGRSVTGPTTGVSGSNFDPIQGFYKPEHAEAIMRKLADYALMLRDFKLAQSTYEIVVSDYKNDKAWKYYAGANEMAAITALLASSSITTKYRVDTIDQMLENAYYSYTTRASAPYNALRTLTLGAELLKLRKGSALDDAARWLSRLVEDRIVGPSGHALLVERIASCYAAREGLGSLQSGGRARKAAFWHVLAADAWLRLDKPTRAESGLLAAADYYAVMSDAKVLQFKGMVQFVEELRRAVVASRPGALGGQKQRNDDDDDATLVEQIQEQAERVDQGGHRKSLSLAAAPQLFDPLGVAPIAPSSPGPKQDGFE